MGKSRLNIELFRAVREKIASDPAAYDQGNEVYDDPKSTCGTVACIGGWADILSAPNDAERSARMSGAVDLDRAADSLGLGGSDFWGEYAADIRTERSVLLTGDPDLNWPEPFAQQYLLADDHAAETVAALAYLDYIIETGKVLE